jgi:predicted nucleic acid-binding protein
VTVAELIGGMRSDERGPVGRLLGAFEVRPVTDLVARQAGDLRRQYRRSHQGIGLADYLIAATALEDGSDLATLNVRHFPMFPMLMAPFSTT